MNNFYTNLKENNNIEFLRSNINDFNNLSDDDIKLLFDDRSIAYDHKTIIAEFCYERINKLPLNLFIATIQYVTNPNLFMTLYGSRINTMQYDELIQLIYDSYCDPECLLVIIKSEVFKLHLENEAKHKNGTKLQSFLISSKIFLMGEPIAELEQIGKEIENLLFSCDEKQYTEDIDNVVDSYLNEVIKNINNIDIHSITIKSCIAIINYNLQCHRVMDSKIIEFYILYRLKDLDLESDCKEIEIIQTNSNSKFGDFQNSSGTLRIFYNYIENIFRPLFKQYNFNDENAINDLINTTFFQMISHELGHIVDGKEIRKYQANNNEEQLTEKIKNINFLNYWFRNGILRLFIGDEKYFENHGKFIEENRADLFSILDSSMQINRNFRQGFTDAALQNLYKNSADKIIKLYTENTNKGLKIVTPMRKFDAFFKEILPDDTEFLNLDRVSNTDTSEQAIINNLLLGDSIPRYVLEEILKIAYGEIITTDLYSELQSIINSGSNLSTAPVETTGVTRK